MSPPADFEMIRDAKWKQRFRRRMISWFQKHARDLPWRQTRDPYCIWVSEIMLQQTQVATVIPYFQRFVARFPTVHDLAKADEQEVLRHWEGLGYYRRARQMHRAAKVVVDHHGGVLPETLEEMLLLPGIGRYTAGAILSIAHDARVPILEANTIRLFSRLLLYRGATGSTDGQQILWQFAEDILPRKRTGAFNQSLMELGSEVCRPREPDCPKCPVMALCPTQALNAQDAIPAKAKKTDYESIREACVVVWRTRKVLLRQCGADERWAGLWDFPRFRIEARDPERLKSELVQSVKSLTGIAIVPTSHLLTLKHGVTRYRITLSCFEGRYERGRLSREDRWIPLDQLHDFPLSTTGRKIAKKLTSR